MSEKHNWNCFFEGQRTGILAGGFYVRGTSFGEALTNAGELESRFETPHKLVGIVRSDALDQEPG